MNTEPEIRCDFEVSSKRKAVWSVQIDLMHEMEKICEKHNIKYWACSGTLLGAIRHKGYIPWDDDMDLVMERNDYERFMKIAEKEMNYPYFMQCYKTDKNYYFSKIRILNLETTCVEKNDPIRKHNYSKHGIFIDIFPMDCAPDNKWLRKIQKDRIKVIRSIIRRATYGLPKEHLRNKVLNHIASLICSVLSTDRLFEHMEKIGCMYNYKKTRDYGELTNFPYFDDRLLWNKEWFKGTLTVPFEDTTIKVPEGYEKILEHHYGDWKKFVRGGSLHEGAAFDTEKPYTSYFDSKNKLKKLLIEGQL